METDATDMPAQKRERTPEDELRMTVARALFAASATEEEVGSKEAWQAKRIEMKKVANRMMRVLDKRGLKIVPKDAE